ncbi:MAG: hypothetical protein Q8R07_02820 [Candidatus Uhrbacteria bacterium]|nr:hypothetical protein [Candidatus Uhrbacteria bacterium]
MIQFLYHPSLEKEIGKMAKKVRMIEESFKAFEKLCDRQFHPENPSQCIAPAKLHRVTRNTTWTMWKMELVLVKSGLRPNQFPRLWFAVQGAKIAFLCMNTHMDNYNDGNMDRLALERVTEIF